MQRLQLEIEGMSCDHCVHAVKTALETIPGLRIESVKVGSAVIQLSEPSQRAQIGAVLEDEGYHLSRDTEIA